MAKVVTSFPFPVAKVTYLPTQDSLSRASKFTEFPRPGAMFGAINASPSICRKRIGPLRAVLQYLPIAM
jgi:hypothetical protein